MAGYSNLRFLNKKSRSIDFSDLLITNTFPDDQLTKSTHDQDASPTGLDHSRRSAAREEMNTIHEHGSDQDQVADARNSCTRKSTTDTGVGGIHLSKNNWFNLRSWQRSATSTTTATTTTSSTPKSGLQSAVKRAFSMRRPSSSSSVLSHHEKYRRIHDQCVAILLESSSFDDEYDYDDNDDDETVETKEGKIPTTMNTMGSMEEKRFGSRGKILKACKRLLRFNQ